MLSVKSATFGSLENNCYLITDEKTNKSALIDCTEDSEKMMNFIKGADLEYILLTHGHFDHIGGVKAVFEKTGAKVLISKEDEPMLSSSKLSLAAFCGGVQNNTAAYGNVADGDVITLGESKIKVIATPGHTKGGVCYVCDNNVFTGDTMFFCSCGRTDFPGGSSQEIMQSLKKIADLVKTRIEVFPDIPDLIDFFETLPEYDPSMYEHKKMKTNRETSLDVLRKLLPVFEQQEDYSNDALYQLLTGFAAENEYKNGYVLWPVRTAVSGKQMTPAGATEIMELLGKEESLARIRKGIELLENS